MDKTRYDWGNGAVPHIGDRVGINEGRTGCRLSDPSMIGLTGVVVYVAPDDPEHVIIAFDRIHATNRPRLLKIPAGWLSAETTAE